MADNQQPGPKATEQLAEKVQKIRAKIEGRMVGQSLTPTERSFKEALDEILDVLDDLAHGTDAGTY